MENQLELNDALYHQLVGLMEEGDALLAAHELDKAREKYSTGLELLPDPKFQWEMSTYIYAALGDTYFLEGKHEDALNSYQCALNSVGGEENPYVNLMLGQSWFELGEREKARGFLLKAYELEGESIFEEEDPKYWDLIKGEV